MTLPDRILLINDLIRENREATVRDYLEAVEEIGLIKPPIKEPIMNVPRLYTAEDADFIARHYHEFTAGAIAHKLKIPVDVVRNFGSRHNLVFRKGTGGNRFIPEKEQAPVKFIRPAAVYNNIPLRQSIL